jgi:NADH dehydrogenase
MQMFMQVSIVLLEIAVGLMLMGGCFTTLAGVASLGLQMMFLTSTGLYMSSWWMIFASAAMLFGAGQVLSFDYYIVPWLKKLWKRVPIARKWYIYND